jgi:hypothetical protein
MGASRASDFAQDGSAGTIGLLGLVRNDFTAGNMSAYGAYVEAQHASGAFHTHGIEVDIVNFGATSDVTPFSFFPDPLTNALWVASGGSRTSPTDATVAIGVIDNNARFRKGIVFKATSLTGTDGTGTGTATAIEMARGHEIRWMNSDGSNRAIVSADLLKLDSTTATMTIGGSITPRTFNVVGHGNFTRADSSTIGPFLEGRYSRGTITSPTATSSGDTPFTLAAWGHDGTNYQRTGQITFTQIGAASTGIVPGVIALWTTNSSGTLAERWRVETGGWLVGKELTANPTTTELSSGDQAAIYVKGDKLVIAYNQGGVIKYITIPLDGSTTTWTNSTTAP